MVILVMKKWDINMKQKNNFSSPIWILKKLLVLAVITASLAVFAPSAIADDDDQETARQALEAGKIRPLMELLEKVESTYKGKILEVELESEETDASDGVEILVYEIKLLTPQGNIVKLSFDASNLDLLVVDGHDSEKALKQAGQSD